MYYIYIIIKVNHIFYSNDESDVSVSLWVCQCLSNTLELYYIDNVTINDNKTTFQMIATNTKLY